jgi:uncharacterized SAM-binding protein YcdF (DUF218 family)
VFYEVSKALGGVTDPAAWAVGLLALAAMVARRSAGLAAGLSITAAALVTSLSSPVVADALQRWIERAAPTTFRPDKHYDAAIVLSGSDVRVVGAAGVVRSGQGRHLLFTGAVTPAEARQLLRELAAMGVPERGVVIPGRARNTRENALEASEVVAERGWRSLLLVTSAAHVPRALACFHRVGLRPDVLPVDYVATDAPPRSWAPSRAGLEQTRTVMHEVIGWLVYRAVGFAA